MNAFNPRFLPDGHEDHAGGAVDPEATGPDAQMALFGDTDRAQPGPSPAIIHARLPRRDGGADQAVGAGGASEPAGSPSLAGLEPPAASLAERLMRSAFALGVPDTMLVAPFRRPGKPRVKATVEGAPLGDRVAGMALRAGHFLVGGVRIPIAQADLSPGATLAPQMEMVLHGFTWLRDLAASAPAPQCAAIASQIMRAWLAANPEPEPARGGAWNIEHVGRRLLAWLVHAPLILGSGDKAYRTEVLAAIGETARWLDHRAAKAQDCHGEALAWVALTAAGLLLPEGKPRRLFAEAGLVRALGAMVSEDGGVLSRSPLAQAEAIAMLLDLAACYRATRRTAPAAIAVMVRRLVPPLVTLAHADGTLGNWQGAGALPAGRVEALVAAAGVRPRPLRPVSSLSSPGPGPSETRQWGYQRIAARAAVLVCDAAPPPLARHARSGCASTLAFEFSHDAHALIVNCGGAALTGGQVPVRIEQGLRATAAHSTLVLGDANSTAVLISGALGKGVTGVEVDCASVMLEAGDAQVPATRLDTSHDGYAARFGLKHRRSLALADDGTVLAGEDRLEPSGRVGKHGKVGYAIRFHLGPRVDLRLASDGHAADLLLPDGAFWRFAADGATIAAEESLWVDGDGLAHPTQQLVLEGLASRAGEAFAWTLRKMA